MLNPHWKQQYNIIFDGSKILFTVIIWLTFFFYEIPTIDTTTSVVPLSQEIIQEKTWWIRDEEIHESPKDHDITTSIIPNLKELLQGFNPELWEYYLHNYNTFCIQATYFCSTIQLQFSDEHYKDYYFWLLSIATIYELQDLLVKEWNIMPILILKNDPNEKKRWYATKHSIVINIYNLSESEFFEVLVHEIGHIIDLAIIEGKSTILNNFYTEFWDVRFAIDDPSLSYYALSRESEKIKKKWSPIEDFCTVYGSQNPFEDFAECFNLYVNHHDYFAKLTATNHTLLAKYRFIESLFISPIQYNTRTQSYNTDTNHRYRDSTKIPVINIDITEV